MEAFNRHVSSSAECSTELALSGAETRMRFRLLLFCYSRLNNSYLVEILPKLTDFRAR